MYICNFKIKVVVDEEFRKYGIGKSILLYGEEILKK